MPAPPMPKPKRKRVVWRDEVGQAPLADLKMIENCLEKTCYNNTHWALP